MWKLDISLEESLAAVVVTLRGDVDGPTYVEAMAAWFGRYPELAALDRVHDLMAYAGSIGHDDLRQLAGCLPEPALLAPAVTVIASPDRFFPTWARSFRSLAPGRAFLVEPSLPEALAALLRHRSAAKEAAPAAPFSPPPPAR